MEAFENLPAGNLDAKTRKEMEQTSLALQEMAPTQRKGIRIVHRKRDPQ